MPDVMGRTPVGGAPGLWARGPEPAPGWGRGGGTGAAPLLHLGAGGVPGLGGGLPAGRQGLIPAPERTEVKCRFPSRASGEAESPTRCRGEGGVCVKVETLTKCRAVFPISYSF